GATFLRKHDRNRHDNGADILTCDECGASIQGKGREYNLQRHKTNYCPARKQATQNGIANRNKDTGHILSQVSNQLIDISQVHGPVTQTSVLSMGPTEDH
ncbi:12740_t:CDS:2, partial [Acaulospora colombiana]